jgi:hemolysin activation/secretion protein
MTRLFRGAAAIALLLAAPQAFAQTSTSRVVNPERPDQQSQGRFSATPALKNPAARPQSGAAVKPFRLTAVAVENSSLDAARIQIAVQPFVGTEVDAAALGKIADAVAALYDGTDIALYTVSIPQQDFAGGRLRLVAVEGHIGKVVAQGDTQRDLSLLQKYARHLTDDRPLHRPVLERYVSLMRDIPGFNPGLSLQNGATPDDVQLLIDAPPQDFRIAAGINNRGTALLGRTQVELDGYYYGLFQQGDETRATVALPTEIDRFQYYALSHSTILDDEGTSLAASIGYLRTRPAFATLKGDAVSLGVQLTHPFIRDFSHALYGTIGVDGLNASNAVFGQTIGSDHVRTLRGSVSYAWQGPEDFVRVNATISRGLGGKTLFPAITDMDFTKINVKAIWNTQLSQRWFVRLDAAAQYGARFLPASEQFALGGDEFGRAYEASFVAGDSGYAGSAELAWQLDDWMPERLYGSELFVFTDGGRVRYNGRLGLTGSDADIASAGVGTRLLLDQRWQLQFEADRGLLNPIPTENREVWRGVFAIRTFF